MKLLLLTLLLPVCLSAQEVQPIVSKDYLDLINRDSLRPPYGLREDTSNSIRNASLRSPGYYSGGAIRRIFISNGYVQIKPAYSRVLRIGGNVSSTFEIKNANRSPGLQSGFAQGRSDNGQLVWRGPEAGEPFSYGPALATLEYDGSSYPYDVNGRLVTKGSGNGRPAQAYDNELFRTAFLNTQSFSLQGKYLVGGRQVMTGTVKLTESHEDMFIPSNSNKGDNLLMLLGGTIHWLTITGSWNRVQERFSNPNRNGFLNRVYQNALLSPASFDNGQGSLIGRQQRSYSALADNPLFLLNDNGNGFRDAHDNASLLLEKKGGPFRFRLAQSEEVNRENSHEGYKPGTAFFSNGAAIDRHATDRNYFMKAEGTYDIDYGDYHIKSVAGVNYIFSDNHSTIDYKPGMHYRYQRSSHDFSLSYQTNLSYNGVEAGLNLADKTYASNTATPGSLFLPSVSGYVRFPKLMDYNLNVRFIGSFNRFNSELPVSGSFASYGLLSHATQDAFQYFPVTEIGGIDGLAPIRRREWSGRMELLYKGRLDFSAEWSRRSTFDDVFPVMQGGTMVLKNIAAHRNDGVELQLGYNAYSRNWRTDNRLSFYRSRLRVTDIASGYNYTPVAGFSDVYKALVKGEAPGVIVGSSYLKGPDNTRVIGNDGFPLVNTTPTVLGNPQPDFVMKLNNRINWKRFTLAVDWEWKKGGVTWNGTQALLDYYGRSETSGLLRNTKGYVFAGMRPDGHANTTPVNFYDPALPVESNRWTRYGYSGVGEEYVQKSDWLRLNHIGLSYKITSRKYIQFISFTLYAGNILLWTPYKGADPHQLLYDQSNSEGLDFFNLPSTRTTGFNMTVQF